MKFEIAPKQYWINVSSFDETTMYLLFLDIDGKRGWRLPKRFERAKYLRAGDHVNSPPWDHLDEHTIMLNGCTKRLVPVRDL